MKDLLELPVYIQIVIASGYAGYIVAQRDYRKNERTMDIWLAILLLGLPSGVILSLTSSPWAYLSVLIAPVLGWLWAAKGKRALSKTLRWSNAAYENNEGDAWNTLSGRKGIAPTQITVTLHNGRIYRCNNVAAFNDCEFAPYIADDDGIAFYVDSYTDQNGQWTDADNVSAAPDWGDKITYFARNDIVMFEVRHTKI